MDFCPVEAALDRQQKGLDANEQKYERMKASLKGSGWVEDAIEKSMTEDGDFEEFVKDHIDGYAVIQLGLLATRRYVRPDDFDTDYLKELANRVCEDFIKENYEKFEEILIEKEWDTYDH